ncbi:GNAT family N-acetyltransferase [Streptomyces sp. NPDC090054]|uniref:GNAT family N-acetyltransferase n=1 Tax=Streptomyces sp. NPDC090054 TaxID=3365933 RepID=UPI00381CF111
MIRNARAADVNAIAALHVRARATYYEGRAPEETYAGDLAQARAREALCAERDGEVTGVAAFRNADGETTLTQFHVDPDHWRRGTGAALHEACLDAWRRAGIERVRLEVFEHNLRAQAFYAAHGWEPEPSSGRSGSHLTLRLRVPAVPAVSGE